ncbi:uncharacterized protein LOC127737220 [Mytilus californianus]|uniref:uncharacterized protein LOC127737220 n=1 Tax=Mytilus californianus TaxID=6549 RepID=UPI002248507B|nr:uncharacterized protein LOC127737220 [Mytilus californianus]
MNDEKERQKIQVEHSNSLIKNNRQQQRQLVQYQQVNLLSFITDPPTITATLPEEDASQDLYESAASLISDCPPLLSPQSPSLLTGYDPILTQTVVPVQTSITEKRKIVRTPSKKVTVQDIHDIQYRALQGKLVIQEKKNIQMDLEKKNWNSKLSFCKS